LALRTLPSPRMFQEVMMIQRNFIWGWNAAGKKMTLVKWENLCKPKEHGGLRTKDNTLSLKALFAK